MTDYFSLAARCFLIHIIGSDKFVYYSYGGQLLSQVTINTGLTLNNFQNPLFPFPDKIVKGFHMHGYKLDLPARPYMIFLLEDSRVYIVGNVAPGAIIRTVEGFRYYDRNVAGTLLTDSTLDFDMISYSFTIILRIDNFLQFLNGCGINQ